jgi:hypothetical protein
MAESDPAEGRAFLRIAQSAGGQLVTSNTGGKVTFWSAGTLAKLREVAVHLSGINSLLELPDTGILTGGDDGALGLVSGDEVRLQTGANSGHVTGIAVLDADRVVTCSVDQGPIL